MIPSAQNLQQLPAVRVLDNSRISERLGQIGSKIGQQFRQNRANKKDLELSKEILSPEQQQIATEGEAVAAQDQQNIQQAQATATSNQAENKRRQKFAGFMSGVDREKWLELNQRNPQMAAGLMNVLVSENNAEKALVAQKAKEAFTLWNNTAQMVANGRTDDARSLIKNMAIQMQRNGEDVSGFLPLLQADNDTLTSEIGQNLSLSKVINGMDEIKAIKQTVLADGSQLVDSTGKVIAENEKDIAPISAFQERSLAIEQEANDIQRENVGAKIKTAELKKVRGELKARSNATRVVSLIDRTIDLATGTNTGRTGQAIASASPSSGAAKLRRNIDTLKANLALDQLIQIKKDGGTLGALNEKEFDALSNKIANLDPLAGADEMAESLRIIRSEYGQILDGIDLPDDSENNDSSAQTFTSSGGVTFEVN